VLAFLRKNGDNEIVTLINFSHEKINFDINDEHLAGKFANVFSNEETTFGNTVQFELQPWGYLVFEKE